MTGSALTIPGLRSFAASFDHVLLDQWGTLHEGKSIFPAARDCVIRLRAFDKRVLVLSNSVKRAASNRRRLAALGLSPDAYDGVLSSGEVTWRRLREHDRNLAYLEFKVDLLAAVYFLQHPGSAQSGMAGKGQLLADGEDPHLHATLELLLRIAGENEGGFGEVHLLGESLHFAIVQAACISKHCQLVALQGT